MRTTQNYEAHTCVFIDDLDDGCLVGFDGIEMNTKDMGDYGTPFISPVSGEEIFYPGWASW